MDVLRKFGEVSVKMKEKHNAELEHFTNGRNYISAAGHPGTAEKAEGASEGRIRALSEALGVMLKGHEKQLLHPVLGNNSGGWFDFATVWEVLDIAAQQQLKGLRRRDVGTMDMLVKCVETSFSASAQVTRFELKKDDTAMDNKQFWKIRGTRHHNKTVMPNVTANALPKGARTEQEYQEAKAKERLRNVNHMDDRHRSRTPRSSRMAKGKRKGIGNDRKRKIYALKDAEPCRTGPQL